MASDLFHSDLEFRYLDDHDVGHDHDDHDDVDVGHDHDEDVGHDHDHDVGHDRDRFTLRSSIIFDYLQLLALPRRFTL